jgi:hypothetical protein
VLKAASFQTPDREWKDKISQWEGGMGGRCLHKDVIKESIPAAYWKHRTLLEVGAQTRDLPKVVENGRQVCDIIFEGSHKNRRVVHI